MITYETNISATEPRTIQFENVNEGRSYPFTDNSTLSDDCGKLLNDNVIADAHFVAPELSDVYLSTVYISPNMLSVCFKVFERNIFKGALSVSVLVSDFMPYMPYRLEKLFGSEDIGGIVTFGNVKFSDVSGTYRFGTHTVRVDDCAISRYKPAGLRKLIDDRSGKSLSGDVKLQFSTHVISEMSEGKIKLTLPADSAYALLSKCDKEQSVNVCGATPIKSINGIKSDDKRRIVLWFH